MISVLLIFVLEDFFLEFVILVLKVVLFWFVYIILWIFFFILVCFFKVGFKLLGFFWMFERIIERCNSDLKIFDSVNIFYIFKLNIFYFSGVCGKNKWIKFVEVKVVRNYKFLLIFKFYCSYVIDIYVDFINNLRKISMRKYLR